MLLYHPGLTIATHHSHVSISHPSTALSVYKMQLRNHSQGQNCPATLHPYSPLATGYPSSSEPSTRCCCSLIKPVTALHLRLYSPSHPSRSIRSSYQGLLSVPRTWPKTKGDQSFGAVAPRLWNALPLDLRSAQSVNSFKGQLTTHLYRQEFEC